MYSYRQEECIYGGLSQVIFFKGYFKQIHHHFIFVYKTGAFNLMVFGLFIENNYRMVKKLKALKRFRKIYKFD